MDNERPCVSRKPVNTGVTLEDYCEGVIGGAGERESESNGDVVDDDVVVDVVVTSGGGGGMGGGGNCQDRRPQQFQQIGRASCRERV